jgi:hypothetical protein
LPWPFAIGHLSAAGSRVPLTSQTLEAFILELDGGVEGERVWMTCTCGAAINRDADGD